MAQQVRKDHKAQQGTAKLGLKGQPVRKDLRDHRVLQVRKAPRVLPAMAPVFPAQWDHRVRKEFKENQDLQGRKDPQDSKAQQALLEHQASQDWKS